MVREFTPSIREEKVIEPNKFFYIASEGIQTEMLYFNQMNNVGNLYKFVHFSRPKEEEGHSSPKNVFKTLKKNLLKHGLDSKNDECWIIVDRDSWEKNLEEAIKLCKTHNYNYAVSSACIEIWFIMHLVSINELTNSIQQALLNNSTFKIRKGAFLYKKNFTEAYLDFLLKCTISPTITYKKNRNLPSYFFKETNIQRAIQQAKLIEENALSFDSKYLYPSKILGSQIFKIIEAFLEFNKENI